MPQLCHPEATLPLLIQSGGSVAPALKASVNATRK
jgi:hypothetical protein